VKPYFACLPKKSIEKTIKVKVKALPIAKWVPRKLKPPTPSVKQPPGSYPRFFFKFVMRNKKGKLVRFSAAAYTTKLAELQCKSLCQIFGYTFVKVVKKERLNWEGYPATNSNAWRVKAVKVYKSKMKLTKKQWKKN
jgi:hypothetical protein